MCDISLVGGWYVNMWMQVLVASRECQIFGVGFRGGCELPDVVALAKLWSSARVVCSFRPWTISQVLEKDLYFLKQAVTM